jgi:hypothetical protein
MWYPGSLDALNTGNDDARVTGFSCREVDSSITIVVIGEDAASYLLRR